MILLKNVMLHGQKKDILIDRNRFTKIADEINEPAQERIDCTNKEILPTFCNAHTHACMMFLRGIGEDKNLFDWLHQEIFPREAKLKKEHYYALSRYAMMEMIKTGTTCFADMYFEVSQTIQAVQDMGMRAVIPYPGMDFLDENTAARQLKDAAQFLQTSSPSEKIKKSVYCHAIYTCSETVIKGFKKLADQYQTYLHMHVSETQQEVDDCQKKYGLRPVELLSKWGILGPRTVLDHAVHLNAKEMQLIQESGTIIVHCPTSNLKLNSGQMPLQMYLDKGIQVTLGTDGVASNNSLSMISEMKIAALSAKNQAESVLAAKVSDIWKMATYNGFKVFDIDAGTIQEGKLADFMLVDLNNQFLIPNNSLISNMIYAADSSCITDVFCDGRALMRDRKIPQEQEIIDDFKQVLRELSDTHPLSSCYK